ncbi:MAG: response regulator [Alphaproteobacteria bacterium]|nr:response regulator [Alphaproteobacteria bacterium]
MSLKINAAGLFNYLPGIFILIFGMLALHSSLLVMEKHHEIVDYYNDTSKNIWALEGKFDQFENVYEAYLVQTPGVTLPKVRAALTDFSKYYDESISQNIWSRAIMQDDRFQHVLHFIGNDLIYHARVLGEMEKGADIEDVNTAYNMERTHELQNKIDEMWHILHTPGTAEDFIGNLKYKEKMLYWSVITIGLAGFVLVVLNSSRLKQLKKVNHEKQTHLKLLQDRFVAMESSSDGIGIVDQSGNLTYMNAALMKLHGLTADDKHQYINQDWTSLYTEKGRQDIANGVMPILRETGFWRGEKNIKRIDGDVILAELSLTALPDGGFIGTARDISEKSKIQKEKDDLQSQFYQAQKMEAIGRLAGGIAHDFNNILAAMNGYAEFLIDDLQEGTPQYKFAQNILQAGKKARNLVDQILAFSRVKESRIAGMDLLSSVREVLSMIDASFAKTIEIKTNIDIEHAPIKGNETQISQVLMNLCVNAKDAMDERHGVLSIDLDRVNANEYLPYEIVSEKMLAEDALAPVRIHNFEEGHTRLTLNSIVQDQSYIRLRISDTGTGMSREVMEHVFEPFFTTKPVDKGTGLGLSTVHGVVIAHNAAMIVESELDKGTSFEILFPEAERVEAAATESESVSVDLNEYNVLLVEDQEEVCEMMLAMLSRMGIKADVARNGMEALEAIQESLEDYDLILTDQNMPKMTGLELIEQAQPDFPNLPFVLISGYSEAKLKGIMDTHPSVKAVLRKPVSQTKLKAHLTEVLGRSEGKAA